MIEKGKGLSRADTLPLLEPPATSVKESARTEGGTASWPNGAVIAAESRVMGESLMEETATGNRVRQFLYQLSFPGVKSQAIVHDRRPGASSAVPSRNAAGIKEAAGYAVPGYPRDSKDSRNARNDLISAMRMGCMRCNRFRSSSRRIQSYDAAK